MPSLLFGQPHELHRPSELSGSQADETQVVPHILRVQECFGSNCTTEVVRLHDAAARTLPDGKVQPSHILVQKQVGQPLVVTVKHDDNDPGQSVQSGGSLRASTNGAVVDTTDAGIINSSSNDRDTAAVDGAGTVRNTDLDSGTALVGLLAATDSTSNAEAEDNTAAATDVDRTASTEAAAEALNTVLPEVAEELSQHNAGEHKEGDNILDVHRDRADETANADQKAVVTEQSIQGDGEGQVLIEKDPANTQQMPERDRKSVV